MRSIASRLVLSIILAAASITADAKIVAGVKLDDTLRLAAEQFLIRLFPGDKAKVGAFNDKIQVGASFTSDRDDLIQEVKKLDYGNATRLYDALALSLDEGYGPAAYLAVQEILDGVFLMGVALASPRHGP